MDRYIRIFLKKQKTERNTNSNIGHFGPLSNGQVSSSVYCFVFSKISIVGIAFITWKK